MKPSGTGIREWRVGFALTVSLIRRPSNGQSDTRDVAKSLIRESLILSRNCGEALKSEGVQDS